MEIPDEETTNVATLDENAESLYSLVADGQFNATSAGRNCGVVNVAWFPRLLAAQMQ